MSYNFIRFTDFIVNEIKLNNEIVWPPQQKDKIGQVNNIEVNNDNKNEHKDNDKQQINVSCDIEKELLRLLKPDDFIKFMKFIDEINK